MSFLWSICCSVPSATETFSYFNQVLCLQPMSSSSIAASNYKWYNSILIDSIVLPPCKQKSHNKVIWVERFVFIRIIYYVLCSLKEKLYSSWERSSFLHVLEQIRMEISACLVQKNIHGHICIYMILEVVRHCAVSILCKGYLSCHLHSNPLQIHNLSTK